MLFAEKFVQLDIFLDKTLRTSSHEKIRICVSHVSERLCEIWSKTNWVGPIQPPKRALDLGERIGGYIH